MSQVCDGEEQQSIYNVARYTYMVVKDEISRFLFPTIFSPTTVKYYRRAPGSLRKLSIRLNVEGCLFTYEAVS